MIEKSQLEEWSEWYADNSYDRVTDTIDIVAIQGALKLLEVAEKCATEMKSVPTLRLNPVGEVDEKLSKECDELFNEAVDILIEHLQKFCGRG